MHRKSPRGPSRAAVRVVEIELDEPAPRLTDAGPVRLLIRRSGRPVAFLPVVVPPGGLPAAEIQSMITAAVPAGSTDSPIVVDDRPQLTATVVVTCCQASSTLTETLAGLRRQTLAPAQILVVDNRPATSGVAGFLRSPEYSNVTLVSEPVPGLSRARNAGLAAATGDVVAFIDDDVVVDSRWLSTLVTAFRSDDSIACVTGLILPLELATPAQRMFEEFGGFDKGLRRRRFNLAQDRDPDGLYPFAAGVFGTGANSSFRTATLRELGGFDEVLGMGTPALGGEDLDIHLSVVQSGKTLLYEPGALVWHRHHRDIAALRRQIHSYGVGMAAMVTKRWVDRPEERRELAHRLVAGLRHLLDPAGPKNSGKTGDYPISLTILELAGVVRGPFAYWHSRHRGRVPSRAPARNGRRPDDRTFRVTTGSVPLASPTRRGSRRAVRGVSADRFPQASKGHQDMTRIPAHVQEPILCAEVDRRDGVLAANPGADLRRYRRARVLVRDQGQPVAFVEVGVRDGLVDVDSALARTRDRSAAPLPSTDAVRDLRVSVVVCTRNRPDLLDKCLDGLIGLEPAPAEIIIVDNGSTDGRTHDVVAGYAAAGHAVQYVLEPTPGLSRARNAGLVAAGGDVVAFTDDDVRVDRGWVGGLLYGFARRPDVACVTGLVATELLDSAAEMFFDARVSWSSTCQARVFDLGTSTGPLHPYAAGGFGTGASVAFRTSAIRGIGGFDESLGVGSPTAGGEDLDAFVRILRAGHALAYEPSALVWHRHRQDPAALRRQMFGYGSGLTAYLTKYMLHAETAKDITMRLVAGVRHMHGEVNRTREHSTRSSLPFGSAMVEVAGLAYGPFAYLRARRTVTAGRRRELRP